MKLPFRVVEGTHSAGYFRVVDANHRVVCLIPDRPEAPKVAGAIVKHFNRGWRIRRFLRGLLRQQPYEYTREDWLTERSSVGGKS